MMMVPGHSKCNQTRRQQDDLGGIVTSGICPGACGGNSGRGKEKGIAFPSSGNDHVFEMPRTVFGV